MKPDELKKQKFIVFHQIFGLEKSIELLGQKNFTIQPISFLYYVFGQNLGNVVIKPII